MSVGYPTAPTGLSTAEGRLLLISIAVEPRSLESLLEILARLDFPVNPQIYHDASVIYRYGNGQLETGSATLVEFPAYDVRLEEVRRALSDAAFDPASMHAADMLDEIHARSAGHRIFDVPMAAGRQRRKILGAGL